MTFEQDQKNPWEFEREKSVLLVIDLQNDFVKKGAIMEVPEAKNQIQKINKLINSCRELKVPTIYTTHVHHPNLNLCPLETKMFPWLKTEGLREGSEGAQIYKEIALHDDEIIVKKRRYSAFYETELEMIIRNIEGCNIDTVIICGTVTNICCESTARDAFFRDFKVVFGSDVNSALSPQAHEASLNNIREVFGRVMDCDSIINALNKGIG